MAGHDRFNDHPYPSTQHMENPDIQSTPLLSDYPHTRRTLQLETGTSEKTVRRWIKKAAVTGHKFENVERFTDAQRDLILSHQAKRKEERKPSMTKKRHHFSNNIYYE